MKVKVTGIVVMALLMMVPWRSRRIPARTKRAPPPK